MNEELMKLGDFDLSGLKVLHMLHELENDPFDVASTARLGFKWAEAGEGQGLFLCVCTERCTEPEWCGRVFYENVAGSRTDGHAASVEMPWPGEDGDSPMIFEVWCCDNCGVRGTGAVYDVWVGRFFDLPARLLAYEHEKRSRDYAGLKTSMGRAYPDEFTEASFVTVLLYRRTT